MDVAQRETLDLLKNHGFELVRRTGSGHELWRLGDETVTVSGPESSHEARAWKNSRGDVRRAIKRHQDKKKAGIVVEESAEDTGLSLSDRLLMLANEVELLEKEPGLQDKIDGLEDQLNEFATDLEKSEQALKAATQERDEAHRASDRNASLLERSVQENEELRGAHEAALKELRALTEKNAHLKAALKSLLAAEGYAQPESEPERAEPIPAVEVYSP